MDKPNILMIAVDCLRSDRVFGKDRNCVSPNVDRLVAEGAGAPYMYVENSVTAPSFASMFTGCYSATHGITALLGCRLQENMTTLADVLMDGGYHNYAEVTGPLVDILGLNQGFDEYNYRHQGDYCHTKWGDDFVNRLRKGGFQSPWFCLTHFWELHEPRQIPDKYDQEKFGANRYDRAWSAMDEYIGRLMDAVGDNTVIILVGDHGERVDERTSPDSILPHFMRKLNVEFNYDEGDNRMDEDLELLHARGDELHHVTSELAHHSAETGGRIGFRDRLRLYPKLLKIGVARSKLQKYSGLGDFIRCKWDDLKVGWAVASGDSLDAQMHLLRSTLKQFHLQHGFHIYDYINRVPFVIHGLDMLPAGKIINSHVRNIDVLPTISELFELPMPDIDIHGRSFAGHFTNRKSDQRPIYMEARGGAQAIHAFYIRGVRKGGYKLAYTPFDENGPAELYDLNSDPDERINILAENDELATKLRSEAEAMAEACQSDCGCRKMSPEDQAKMVEKLKSLGYM